MDGRLAGWVGGTLRVPEVPSLVGCGEAHGGAGDVLAMQLRRDAVLADADGRNVPAVRFALEPMGRLTGVRWPRRWGGVTMLASTRRLR